MSSTLPAPTSIIPPDVLKQIRKVGPLTLVVLLHIALFYALQSGLIRQAVQAMPKEIFASLITPEPEPAPKPPPAEPKTVPVVKKTISRPKPVPVVNTQPSEQAITAPPEAPQQKSPEPPSEPSPAVPAAAPAPAAPAPPKVISGVAYITPPQPEYPGTSRRMGEEGTAMIRVLINEKGRAESASVQKTSGFAKLDEAARQAVMRAVFKPYIEDGKPASAYTIIPIKFQLNN